MRVFRLEKHLVEALKVYQVGALVHIDVAIAKLFDQFFGQEDTLEVLVHRFFQVSPVLEASVVGFRGLL